MMTISSSASPMDFSSTPRKRVVNRSAKALLAASIMRREVRPRGPRGKPGGQTARDSVASWRGSVSAGTSATSSSASAAGRPAQAMAL